MICMAEANAVTFTHFVLTSSCGNTFLIFLHNVEKNWSDCLNKMLLLVQKGGPLSFPENYRSECELAHIRKESKRWWVGNYANELWMFDGAWERYVTRELCVRVDQSLMLMSERDLSSCKKCEQNVRTCMYYFCLVYWREKKCYVMNFMMQRWWSCDVTYRWFWFPGTDLRNLRGIGYFWWRILFIFYSISLLICHSIAPFLFLFLDSCVNFPLLSNLFCVILSLIHLTFSHVPVPFCSHFGSLLFLILFSYSWGVGGLEYRWYIHMFVQRFSKQLCSFVENTSKQ